MIVEDGQEAGLVGNERAVFEKLLPLNNKQVVPASEAPKDETVVRERVQRERGGEKSIFSYCMRFQKLLLFHYILLLLLVLLFVSGAANES